jgi:DNA-binding MarR family transcriptional regulator
MTKRSLTKRSEQLDLDLPLHAGSLQFFSMFSAEIKAGRLVPRLGATAFTVWVVLRAFAELETGRVFLSLSEIHSATGLGIGTIRRAIAKLEGERLIQVVQDGQQRRRYFVVDLLPFKTVREQDHQGALEALAQGENDGVVALRYVPQTARKDRDQVATFLHGGNPPTSPHVQVVGEQKIIHQHVEHQHVHVHVHGDGQRPGNDLPPFIQATMDRVRRSLERQQNGALDHDEGETVSTMNTVSRQEKQP